MLLDVFIGLMISFIIAFLAYKKKSLNLSGFYAALIFGTLIYVFGGYAVWGALILFFISSSLLTKLHEKKDKEESKGRNYIQVISNAFATTLFSILYFYFNQPFFLLAAVVGVASSNADTWASEIGMLSKGKTFYILNFKKAPKGVSGAISVLGTLASFIGALYIALVFLLLFSIDQTLSLDLIISYGLIITLCGFIGCLIDSYLGVLLQAKYKGIKTGTVTEKKWLPHEGVVLTSGLAIITNDMVNLMSTVGASLISILLVLGG